MIPKGLYGMADRTYGDPWSQLRILHEEGVGVVQIRCKGWGTDALAELATRAIALGGWQVIVNDDVVAATRSGAWVHLGQDDGATVLPHGRSTHTLPQVREARASYLGFGPIFPTGTKVPAYGPRGLEMLAEAVAIQPAPIVAIGGISRDNLDAVRATGVHAWAVIGAIWRAPEPRLVIRAMLR